MCSSLPAPPPLSRYLPAPAIISRCRGSVPSGSSSASLLLEDKATPHQHPIVAAVLPPSLPGRLRSRSLGTLPPSLPTYLSRSLAASLMAFSGVTPVRFAPRPAAVAAAAPGE